MLIYVPSDVCPGGVQQAHMVVPIFRENPILISIVAAVIYIPTTVYKPFHSPSSPTFVGLLFVSLIKAIMTGVRQNVNIILICISFIHLLKLSLQLSDLHVFLPRP
jgi:hypothetical protein